MEIQFIVTLIVLAVLGIADSGYLTYKHFNKKEKLVCPIGGNCEEVIESKWGKIFGIKNEILGLFFYIGILILGIYLIYNENLFVKMILFWGSLIGVLFSLFLIFVQSKILKKYCFYCLISAFITGLIFVNTIFLY